MEHARKPPHRKMTSSCILCLYKEKSVLGETLWMWETIHMKIYSDSFTGWLRRLPVSSLAQSKTWTKQELSRRCKLQNEVPMLMQNMRPDRSADATDISGRQLVHCLCQPLRWAIIQTLDKAKFALEIIVLHLKKSSYMFWGPQYIFKNRRNGLICTYAQTPGLS